VWEKEVQMQRVSIVGEKGESSTCDKATKDTAKEETSTPCEGRSTEKKVEEGKREEGSACGQATRSTARIEEEFGKRIEEKSRGAL